MICCGMSRPTHTNVMIALRVQHNSPVRLPRGANPSYGLMRKYNAKRSHRDDSCRSIDFQSGVNQRKNFEAVIGTPSEFSLRKELWGRVDVTLRTARCDVLPRIRTPIELAGNSIFSSGSVFPGASLNQNVPKMYPARAVLVRPLVYQGMACGWVETQSMLHLPLFVFPAQTLA
jgi:hypothetical protein